MIKVKNLKETLRKSISNIPGWRTNRKIIVFESDDWGSVRIKNKQAYDALKSKGLNVDKFHYDSVETLESNQDLEYLFELLLSIKDSKGNHPVFTAMCIMGNPDFEKIKESDFMEYHFQPLQKTIDEFPHSNRIIDLWKLGYQNNIFVPEIHGREHINVFRYMEILQHHEGREGLRYALQYHSVGPLGYKNYLFPNYLCALHPKSSEEIPMLHEYVLEAGKLFETYMGYQPRVFIAPNAEEPKELESSLNKIGVKFLTRSKKRIYPLGDEKFAIEWNFVGKKTKFNQTILNRNAFFEPVTWGEHEHIHDWVQSCLKDIEIAFRLKKPAVISSHRVNYVGNIRPENRDKGLTALKELLTKLIKRWPDVEFMSSYQLGKLITESNQYQKI